MTLDILHKQGGVKVGTRVSPTSGFREQFSSFVGATILKIERWWVIVRINDGSTAKIYVQQKGALGRIHLMRYFEESEEQLL